MMSHEERQDFDDTVSENGRFSELYEQYSSPEHFLIRSEKIYARSIALNAAESDVWLNYISDIDGCVVELKGINFVRIPVRHVTLCQYGLSSVREIRSVLKKHVDLTGYSQNALRNFNNSVGIQVFYEHGWEGWIGMIPNSRAQNVVYDKKAIKQRSHEIFMELRSRVKEILLEYASRGLACRTLMKNDINDLGKMFVLPNDCSLILDVIQRALEGLTCPDFKPIVFCFRFGEKMTCGVSLTDFHKEGIEKITAHAAVDIYADCGINLLWSIGGLQEVVGDRGRLFTCLSFSDCGNFQSNLDGRCLSIHNLLRSICRYPLRFVQLYADLPHMKPKTRFHPVSGCIVGGRCLPKPSSDAFFRDAQHYISSLYSNLTLLRKSTCRIEFVTEVISPTDVIRATDCLDLSKLTDLLMSKPMLVPFPPDTIVCIRHLGLWITSELEKTLQMYRNTGNVCATWHAFQLELAVEKLLWGGPHCHRSIRYAVNLGPGIHGVSRSLTDYLGFLALEASSSCMASNESIPTYLIWTMSEVVGKSISRAAGFHDHLEASYSTIGRRLLFALLGDLYEYGKVSACILFEDFVMEMKATRSRFRVNGSITSRALVDILTKNCRGRPHTVFGHLCDLLKKSGVPLKEVITSGIQEMNLTHFPAVQTNDEHRNAVLSWLFKNNFWRIIRSSAELDTTSNHSPERYTDLVKAELDKRGIIFASKLQNLPPILPWIESCVRKLGRMKLTLDGMVITLTFISCVALLMQGWFVDFTRLVTLISDAPVSQLNLKALEIQAKFEIANFKFRQLTLFRLHHSIPHCLPRTNPRELQMHINHAMPEADIPDAQSIESCTNLIKDDELSTMECIEQRTISCRPVEQRRKPTWSSDELEMLHDLSSMMAVKTTKQLYDMFKTKCLIMHIPLRTFRAFESKLKRIN